MAKQKASVSLEKQAYEALRKSTVGWEEQASQTLLLERALEYVRTAEVKHTSNKWKKDQNGSWEISNRVYQMWYRFSEDTHYDKGLKKTVTDAWRVTWCLVFNVPRQPQSGHYSYQFTGDSIKIAGQDNKRYDTQEAAQRYIQGRFDLYADYFTELSPPIPDKEKRMFSVNGQLLPGYTVEPKRETVVTELMDLLTDDDFPGGVSAGAEPKPKEKSPAKPQNHGHPNKSKSRPVR